MSQSYIEITVEETIPHLFFFPQRLFQCLGARPDPANGRTAEGWIQPIGEQLWRTAGWARWHSGHRELVW